jgi:hypothetical protein
LRDDLRALLRSKVDKASGGEGYDVVGARVGISGPGLHDLLSGKTSSSFAVPALCKLYGIDPLEYLPLDEEQLEWLHLLDELRSAGKDPRAILQNLRALALPPAPDPEPSQPAAPPPKPAPVVATQVSRARPGRVKSRGTGE